MFSALDIYYENLDMKFDMQMAKLIRFAKITKAYFNIKYKKFIHLLKFIKDIFNIK